jgi:hypothetical protein
MTKAPLSRKNSFDEVLVRLRPVANQSEKFQSRGGSMSLKSKIYRVALACFLVLSMFSLAFADTIRLKDGSIIKGKIINFGEGKFTIVIGEGSRQRQMNFFADEVDSIEFDSVPLQASNNNKTTLPTYANTSVKREPEIKKDPVNPNNTIIIPGQGETTTQSTSSKNVIITDKTTAPNTPVTTNQPNTNSTVTPTVTNNNTANNTPSNSNYTNNLPTTTKTDAKPVMLNVKVLADNTANGWSNSGWVVKKGQKIRITGKGQVSLGNGRFSSSAGIGSLPDKDKLMSSEATGGLIAVIGDDNNEFIFIGAAREFVAPRDGALFLGINEGNLNDNSGAFDVTIEIVPN